MNALKAVLAILSVGLMAALFVMFFLVMANVPWSPRLDWLPLIIAMGAMGSFTIAMFGPTIKKFIRRKVLRFYFSLID